MTFSTAEIGVERVAVDEVDDVAVLLVVQRRTAVSHRCVTMYEEQEA